MVRPQRVERDEHQVPRHGTGARHERDDSDHHGRQREHAEPEHGRSYADRSRIAKRHARPLVDPSGSPGYDARRCPGAVPGFGAVAQLGER
jgi:hypothetical protein